MVDLRKSLLARNPSFLRLWTGHVISAFGDRLFFMALLALMLGLLKEQGVEKARPSDFAALNLAQYIPFLLLSGFGGLIVDRFSRKWSMVMTDVVRGAIVLALPVVYFYLWPSMWCLFLSLSLLSVFSTIFSPAKSAILPNVVDPKDLLSANSLSQATSTIATMIGTLVGGYIAKHFLPASFFIDAATFIISAVLIGSVVLRRPQDYEARSIGYWKELVEGLRFLKSHRTTRELVFMYSIFWSACGIIYVGLMSMVTMVFGRDIEFQGLFLATIGAGMIIGAATTLLLGKNRSTTWMLGWACVLSSVVMTAFAFNSNVTVGFPLVFGLGISAAVILITIETTLQRITPDRIRGRVFGAKDMISWTGFVAANLMFVVFKDHFDYQIQRVLLVTGGALLATGVIGSWIVVRRRGMRGWLPFWWLFTVVYCRVFHGIRHTRHGSIPFSGPVIIAANHTCGVDPLLLMAAAGRPLSFLVAKEYYEQPIFGSATKMVGCIPVDRETGDPGAVKKSIRRLEEGGAVGIFPEGKINLTDGPLPPREGVGFIALKAGCRIVPAFISGTRISGNLLGAFLAPTRSRVTFGPSVTIPRKASGQSSRDYRKEVAELILKNVYALGKTSELGG